MTAIPEKFLRPYNPQETEGRIYELWEKSGFFNPDECVAKGVTQPNKKPFSIVLPPPNVTGTLHTGHALMLVIEDILVRYARLQGRPTLWLPGTDHAAIATESKVTKLLEKEGKRKRDMGREEFLKRVHTFAQESHDTIVSQVKKMGASLDWSREAYTLDEKREKAVRTAFKHLYDLGLIYTAEQIVNWDPKDQTTVSDDEVVHEEITGTLYTFRYSRDFPIPISTTRPETKLGDTAVAVHPDDKRYRSYVGKTFEVDFAGQPLTIKIIADEAIDPEFGTGAVGVTPAHSFIDWELAQRHDLPRNKQVINEYARMVHVPKHFQELKTTEAREKLVTWLKTEKLLEKEETVPINLSKAERSGGTIEPLPKRHQWFIAVNKPFTLEQSHIKGIKSGERITLKNLMLHVVTTNQITILPERFKKVYFHWIENLRDWNISRQIWFGHRVPVWRNKKNPDEILVCPEHDPGEKWEQESDTLDTWFSSGLWTFSTLGWPEKTSDLETFHPTSLLETGYDILFFWVARMILMSGALLGDIPFHTAYLHGLVRDEKGRKMSKSLGNIVDPVVLIDEFGADALRMAMIVGVGPGSDSNLGTEKVRAYKKFANKLWNIARFVLENTSGVQLDVELTQEDTTLLKKSQELAAGITKDIKNYNLHLASEKIYHYIWHTFADEIIEKSKDTLENSDAAQKASKQRLLLEILATSLQLLHPFMPFITEEIWQELPKEMKDTELLMVSKWPVL